MMTQEYSRRKILKIAAAGAAIPLVAGCVGTNRATGRTSFTGIHSVEDDLLFETSRTSLQYLLGIVSRIEGF